MNMSIAKASHIWQLQPNIKLNKRVFATIETENILKFLQMMMVNFVRFHQLTVIPFPVKYLREFIQLEEKKKSAWLEMETKGKGRVFLLPRPAQPRKHISVLHYAMYGCSEKVTMVNNFRKDICCEYADPGS